MFSVTQRIKYVKQPYGGYLPFKEMDKLEYGGDFLSSIDETSSSSCVGLAVDYLSRFELCHDFNSSFNVSLNGLER